MTGVGYDHIDVKALTAANVMLCFAPDAVRRPMAATVFTFVLALATRLLEKDKLTREGRWLEQNNYPGEGLAGKTFGSIGVGNIGREFFKLVTPFGMNHLACDPYVSQEAVDDLGVKLVEWIRCWPSPTTSTSARRSATQPTIWSVSRNSGR